MKKVAGFSLAIIFVYALLVVNSLPQGNIIFVDDDFTNEPSNHKWNSIQLAINDAQDGDIIYIFEGNYVENIFVNKRVRIIGESPDKVIIDGNDRKYAVNLLKEGIIIENVSIKNGDEAGIYTQFNNITIKNCKIYDNGMYGILINSSNISLINCSIYDNIVAAKSNNSNTSFQHCIIYSNEWGIIAENSYCIIENSEMYEMENKSIWFMNCEGKIENVSVHDSFCGIWFYNVKDSYILSNNITSNIVGIRLQNSTHNEIRDCNFINNFGYGIYLDTSYDNIIHHNNFVGNGINAYDNGYNTWNSRVGNYWDDSNMEDKDNDGILDEQYVNGNIIDYYPLANKITYPPKFVWVDDDFDESTAGYNIDCFNDIQAAIDILDNKGKCFVYEGNYEGIEISKEIRIIGKNAFINGVGIFANNVSIEGIKSKEIRILNAKGISLENIEISDELFGLYIINVSNCTFKKIYLHNNSKAIYLFNSNNNKFFSIKMENNFCGFEAKKSLFNEIRDCNFINNFGYGIYLDTSYDNIIHHNNFVGNGINAYDNGYNTWNSRVGNYWDDSNMEDKDNDGILDEQYVNGNIIDYYPLANKITYPPKFVWVDDDFDESTAGYNIDCFNDIQAAIDILDNKGKCFVYEGNYEGIEISKEIRIIGKNAFINGVSIFANNVSIKGIEASSGNIAIFIAGDNFECENCIFFNSRVGMLVKGKNATIESCYIMDNSLYGIFSNESISIKNCKIYGNNIGIEVKNNVSIEKCEIKNNTFIGVKINSGNKIWKNTIENNDYGIYCNGSDNIIYLNNFVGNIIHVYDMGKNRFNTSMGNYWDDYTGSDTNEDGIGDTPYKIDNDSIDYYPLVRKAGYPVAYFNYTPLNITTQITVRFFDKSIDFDGYIVSWLWDFGDGNVSYERNTSHRYRKAGMYIVNLTVKDDDGMEAKATKEIVVLNVPPVANFSYSPLNPTDVDIITFNASSSYDLDGYIVNYTWHFGDGSIGYGKVIQHSYADDGIYYVSLVIKDDDGAVTNITKDISMSNVKPIANFSYYPIKSTTQDTIYFTDLSYDIDGYIVSWLWDFGDGNVSYERNTSHRYRKAGMYIVNLTVKDDDGMEAKATKEIVVLNVPPVANFSYSPLNPTDVDIITFNASSSYDLDGYIVNYTWHFGDGSIGYGKVIQHSYADDGIYYVSLVIKDDDGATTNITKDISISNVKPIANFEWHPEKPTDLDMVAFKDLSVDADGYIVNYTWDFGDGNTSYERNPKHKYAKNGIYEVKLTIKDDDNATSSITKEIVILNIPPVANFSYKPLQPTDIDMITFNASLSYDADGSIVNYTWHFGDGSIGYGKVVYHGYADDGIYNVSLLVTDDDGAKDEIIKRIEIRNVKPVAIFNYKPSKPREKEKVTFDASPSYDADGSIISYEWDFDGDENIDAYGKEATFKYKKKGDYIAKLIVKDDDNETDTYQLLVKVREKEKIPGFELPFAILSIAILIFLRRRRKT